MSRQPRWDIRTWVARFGIPSDISSNRDPQFTPELWSEGCSPGWPHDSGWVDRLSRVMSVFRTAPTEVFELRQLSWFMTNHCGFMGILYPTSPPMVCDSSELLNTRMFALVPTSQLGLPQSYIPPGSHDGPLQPPDDVLETRDKAFIVDI